MRACTLPKLPFLTLAYFHFYNLRVLFSFGCRSVSIYSANDVSCSSNVNILYRLFDEQAVYTVSFHIDLASAQ